MKINQIYNKHAARLLAAAENGRPFAVLIQGADCPQTRFRTFADKTAADKYLDAATAAPARLSGTVVETSVERQGPKTFFIRPVTGYRSFA